MFDFIGQFAERFVHDFKWSSFFRLIAVLVVCVAAITAYESYTGHFRLSKLERMTRLMESLSALPDPRETPANEAVSQIRKAIEDELVEFSSGHLIAFGISNTALKVGAAAFPWLLFGSAMFMSDFNKGSFAALFGMIIAGSPFILIAAYLPDYEHRWINIVAYPFGSMFMLVTVVILWGSRKKKSNQPPQTRSPSGPV